MANNSFVAEITFNIRNEIWRRALRRVAQWVNALHKKRKFASSNPTGSSVEFWKPTLLSG